jgi:hypothetical protein
MAPTSRHVSTVVDRPAAVVYAVAADPERLPEWAAGLAGATVVRDGDQWATESPMGRVRFAFVPRNDLGVLDHTVTLPTGEAVLNPMRVVPVDDATCEVVFSVRRRAGMSDDDLERDAQAVARDLEALKELAERA